VQVTDTFAIVTYKGWLPHFERTPLHDVLAPRLRLSMVASAVSFSCGSHSPGHIISTTLTADVKTRHSCHGGFKIRLNPPFMTVQTIPLTPSITLGLMEDHCEQPKTLFTKFHRTYSFYLRACELVYLFILQPTIWLTIQQTRLVIQRRVVSW